MDSRKHENWTYFGSHNELSTLQIRSRSSNSICERRHFSILGQNFLRNDSLCEQLHQIRHAKSCRSTRRGKCTNKLKCGCSQIESKSKTSTEGVYWHNDHPIKWKSMDWHWTIKTRSRVVQFVEESHQSSSTQSEITSRTRWSIQFYKIKFHLRDYPLPIQNWSDDRWLACLAAGGGSKWRYQYCSDYLGSIIYLRALQGHSGDSLIDLALQDNVLIGPGVFPYIYHVGSNCSLSPILSNGLIPGGQNLSRRQSVFFLPVDPRDENHRDPENIDYSVPRRARYMQKSWKRHQDTVFWIDIDLGIIKEGLKFFQIRSNAIILQGALPASCIVESWKIEKWRKIVMKGNICLLVHHRRSLRGTISIGIKDKIRVLQLNIDQSGNSFNSHLEKQFNLVLPSQPNPLNPLKIVRGNP